MPKEHERKFLLKGEAWRSATTRNVRLIQGYLANASRCSVRVRIAGQCASLNLKSATLGVSRTEFEYPIPLPDAREILDELCIRPLIEKTRYYAPYRGHIWEIDVFAGENRGLAVAEIELAAPELDFPLPPWAGREVSDDPRYYNVSLVSHPYKDWKT